jgi:putative methyltransferase (TIGR04325 family)
MLKRVQTILDGWLPSVPRQWLSQRFGASRYHGDFACWADALKHASGYSSEAILARVRASALEVKEGRSVFERDSVLFDRVEHSASVLAGLLLAASGCDRRMRVLDFGGALGSSYQQNRRFLTRLNELRWTVLEQPKIVMAGKHEFEDGVLGFESDLDTALQAAPHLALLSSVLPYIEFPYATLQSIIAARVRVIVVDRTPFGAGPKDRLRIQTVPRSIFPATLPAWLLSRSRFLGQFASRYRLVEEVTAPTRSRASQDSNGYVFELDESTLASE